MSVLKTKQTAQDVLEFIAAIEPEQKQADCRVLLEMMKKITGLEPKVWGNGTIGFGTFTYKQSGGKVGEWYIAGFSPRKQNISVHIMAGFDRFPDLMDKLGKYKNGAGCLYINKLADVNTDILEKVIKEGIAFMKEKYNA